VAAPPYRCALRYCDDARPDERHPFCPLHWARISPSLRQALLDHWDRWEAAGRPTWHLHLWLRGVGLYARASYQASRPAR